MYIVIEMQKTENNMAIVPPVTYNTMDAADAAYHSQLAAASVSTVPVHTVFMVNEYGDLIKAETHTH